ncbi:TniQ family protein [Microbulbifer variabilis]|uniref:TniQ family protein n=1 Tax=Microbulbifer variabilis TaxID=266805 RepID=A0ABY4VA69_9GAMM|nr:TniQ family protein [Microbulbifer variabilis]USD21134.1 TniQ family protein [Microbulbifer variabilis]
MNFLYREKKFVDESLSDYVGRLAYWNGYRNSKVLISLLIKTYSSLLVGSDISERERARLSNINVEYKYHNLKWHKIRIALEFILRRYFILSELNLYEKPPKSWLYESKLCCKCWDDNPYVRFYWRDRLYSVCHLHDEKLVKIKDIPYGTSSSSLAGKIHLNKFNYNCGVTKAILDSHIDTGCSLSDLNFERAVAEDERKLWHRVRLFMKDRFLWEVDLECHLDIQELSGLSITVRLERIISKLHYENKLQEKLLRVVLILQILRGNLLINICSSVSTWVISESYSINPVLYFYVKGVRSHLFAKNKISDRGIVCSISFCGFSDRQLCKFILESEIFTPDEIKMLHGDGMKYSTGCSDPRGRIGNQYYDYDEYIDYADQNVFEVQPIKRGNLI